MAECDAVHVQGTTSALPAPITVPATTAAAFVDENANRARTSYPASSFNNPANLSLLTAASLNPDSTTATPPQRSITMTISLPTTLHWTDHEPWVDGRCA
ncbi:hypothetical protein MSAN_01506700 [Mycena sanguinolenta]|uniref:Uncharacterized protein n=1 Tax=Mycena sanguinolenta TaxID=230812 RepID=A0A8H6Y6Q3_9AGAR|nr:hypothetical protein MSAN_01506700 [Mycena sanguinolenta]